MSNVDVGLLEVLVGVAIAMLAWIWKRQDGIESKLEGKADKVENDHLRADIKEVLDLLTDVRIENAKWQGLMEKAVGSKLGIS